MILSLIQSNIAWNAPLENIQRCTSLAQEPIAAGADIIVFPEMFTCGFSMPTGEIATESSRRGGGFLEALSSKHSVYTVGSLPEVDPEGNLYNTAWIVGPSGERTAYRKIHPFSFGGEADIYSSGTETRTAIIHSRSGETLRCTALICYDLRFAPLFWSRAAHTDLFLVVANWPSSRREHWLTLLRARAIENQAYVAGVNRVGVGGGLEYSGDSVLFAPDGAELGKLSDQEGILTCDVHASTVSSWRDKLPAIRDRRPSVYADLTEK
jgi:predicted amidohydrolase